MKSRSIRLFGPLSYRVDTLIVAMFVATALDALTTYLFISQDLGAEMNGVLASLTKESLAWIPVYLFAMPLLVPIMRDGVREAFATYYLLIGLALGINNLGGILYDNYFLVDNLGFKTVRNTCAVFAAVEFVLQWPTKSEERPLTAISLVAWVLVMRTVETVFKLISDS